MMLQHLRADRRKLIEFIVSSDLISSIKFPDGCSSFQDADLDTISADYVLECSQSGRVLDISEAASMCYDKMNLPIMINSRSGCSFFLVTDPESSGSPPRCAPPHLVVNMNSSEFSCSSDPPDDFVPDRLRLSDDECGNASTVLPASTSQPSSINAFQQIGLPSLQTNLSEDDMHDAAYEILLASLACSGHMLKSSTSGSSVQISESKKKSRQPRSFLRHKNKHEDISLQTRLIPSYEILDVIRMQMEISEVIDRCVREGLFHASLNKETGQIDVPKVLVELLTRVPRSSFPNERSYMRWANRQIKILEEVLCDHFVDGAEKFRAFLEETTNSKARDPVADFSQFAQSLAVIERSVKEFSSMPKEFGILGESCYWKPGYHINIRLYEKLLSSTFDILDCSQQIEETEDILGLISSTWSTLGITEKIHTALYCWVLFRQFASTGESTILELAVLELQKLQALRSDDNEVAYLKSLSCTIDFNGSQRIVDFLSAIILSIYMWCGFQLSDYHQHFYKNPGSFERVVTSSILVETLINAGFDEIDLCQLLDSDGSTESREFGSKRIEMYITSSSKAACKRALDELEARPNAEGAHPLALLANELRSISEREYTMFSPVLSRWYTEAKEKYAMLVHEFYGEKLNPFLHSLSQPSEDARCVLPAAVSLESYLSQFVSCAEDMQMAPLRKEWHPYQAMDNNPLRYNMCGYEKHQTSHFFGVHAIAYPLMQDWIDAQRHNMLEWTERACALEVWEPLSSLQRHAGSIVEVFRIIEETVDQFFNLSLPVDIGLTRSLLSGIAQCLEIYVRKVSDQLGAVDKGNLYPAMPALTRYKEATMNPFNKKKFIECKLLEENVLKQLNNLTVFKLCVQANTLHYLGIQIKALEGTIQKHWMHVKIRRSSGTMKTSDGELPPQERLIEDSLAIFDCVQDTANDTINRICDFVGARVVFWDLRESFLLQLYRGSVGNSRLDTVLGLLDTVLNDVCDLIVNPLRDLIVEYIFQASLEAYVSILLDGGPSRVFLDTDVAMMREDLIILMDFFIADGEGLPRALVEEEASLAQQIIDLYDIQAETIIERLMAASEQISTEIAWAKPRNRSPEDADILLRVLCHKGDRTASKFLRMQYNLPKSSDYEEGSSVRSPVSSKTLMHSTSARWAQSSQRSIRTMKKKLQQVKSELKYGGW